MNRNLIFVMQICVLVFSSGVHGFDLFGSASVSADRMEYASELIGSSMAKFKCPNGTDEKSNPEPMKPGFDLYWKEKYCAGIINGKNIQLQVKAIGGDLIGFVLASIDINKMTTCDSYLDSKIPFEATFFKNAKVENGGYIGVTDRHSKNVIQRAIFSCRNNKTISWITYALPLEIKFEQFASTTTVGLLAYPIHCLSAISKTSKDTKVDLGITVALEIYSKDLNAGLSKAAVDKIRKSILTNDNPSAMLQIFNDAVDATLDMNRARQFLKAQGLK